MLQDVKLALRVSNDIFDDEINLLIESAKQDLKTGGINPDMLEEKENIDPMLKTAIITYCKASFGMANPDSEKYMESYEMQKIKLSLSGVHNVL